ncbi:SAM-dependent methyltransferase [Gordonia sp. CPCC 206044]|uniref:SAM-dependent methyltransferase n=1 Tax=Gordonia sp. CPCC 206044 TaxID=3140793 RepID=UPI003AF3D9B7
MTDLDAVGQTALGVALARGIESLQPDALFRDPLAEAILASSRPDVRASDHIEVHRERRAMYLWIVARTVFLDAVFERATASGIGQFVILGSGLDGRGFRCEFADDARLFEIDRPQIVDIKESAVADSGLAPTVDRRPVACDLGDDWLRALQDSGFRPDLPSAWLAEGLFVYLPDDVVTRVIEGVGVASQPGSRIGATVRSTRRGPESADDPYAEIRALWHDNPDIAQAFESSGWDCSVTDSRTVLAAHGRRLPDSAQRASSLLAGVRRG